MLTTQRLTTGKLPSLTSQASYVYDRPVCLQVRSANVNGLSGGGVLVLNQDERQVFQDMMVTV